MRILLALLPLAAAMGQTPSFRADRVLPSGADHVVPIAPGMLFSIYGENLGPATACTANADTRRTETPSPTRPWQNFAERLMYPAEVCGVQVFLAGRPAGILYVSDKQINFKIPQDAPVDGEVELKVVYQDRAGTAKVRVGLEATVLSVDGEARVGGPVWLHVEVPYGWGNLVQYPVRVRPAEFGCHHVEVRRNGELLPRIALRAPEGGIAESGPACGNLGFYHPVPHTGRLPLHLQYKFTEPGTYEVQYSYRRIEYPAAREETSLRSAWIPIEILPRATARRPAAPAPAEPEDLLSNYLPSLLGFADRTGLDAVIAALYHPDQTVRSFALNALSFWPKDESDARVDHELALRGPCERTVYGTLRRHPEMLPIVLRHLKSEDRAVLRGAVEGASRWNYDHSGQKDVEDSLLAASAHVLRTGDEQTVSNYAAALGSVRDPRAGQMLWDFVARHVAGDQPLIAICWRKDPRDLPKLGAILEAPASGANSLPYAMRNSFGEAARPYLESALRKSGSEQIRAACARELENLGKQ